MSSHALRSTSADCPGSPYPSLELKADSEFQVRILAPLRDPSAFADGMTLFFHAAFRRASDDPCQDLRKSRPQGLATLSTVSALSILGTLSQFPTLVGFSLQSFSPNPRSRAAFASLSALTLSDQTYFAWSRRSSGLIPRVQPYPLPPDFFTARVGPPALMGF
jgi:hypothetical protein